MNRSTAGNEEIVTNHWVLELDGRAPIYATAPHIVDEPGLYLDDLSRWTPLVPFRPDMRIAGLGRMTDLGGGNVTLEFASEETAEAFLLCTETTASAEDLPSSFIKAYLRAFTRGKSGDGKVGSQAQGSPREPEAQLVPPEASALLDWLMQDRTASRQPGANPQVHLFRETHTVLEECLESLHMEFGAGALCKRIRALLPKFASARPKT